MRSDYVRVLAAIASVGGVAYDADLAVSVGAGATLSVRMDTSGGGQWEVDWGDGIVDQWNSAATASHTYGPAYTGDIKVRALVEGEELTYFNSTAAGWAFDVADLPSQLTTLSCTGANTISGDTKDLPSGLTSLTCYGDNTISGDVADFPASMTFLSCRGYNTISGDVADLPASMTYLVCQGYNTISGDVADLPASMTSLTCYGYNTISGDIENSPSGITLFNGRGSNTITYGGGTWYSSTMRYLYIRGASGLSSAVVDDLLIELANTVTTWTYEKIVNIRGSRTTTSDAAVATLNGLGVTVTVSA